MEDVFVSPDLIAKAFFNLDSFLVTCPHGLSHHLLRACSGTLSWSLILLFLNHLIRVCFQ